MSDFFKIAVILFTVALGIAALVMTLHGIYLAFSVSAVAGFFVLLIEPSPFLISLVYLITGQNVIQIIAAELSKYL